MQKYRQVSGGNCQLVLYRESKAGVPDPADAGVVLSLYSESMSVESNKQASAVISGVRGQGKPVPGVPNYPGSLEVPPYAPQLGHFFISPANSCFLIFSLPVFPAGVPHSGQNFAPYASSSPQF